jgi:hypothetical protein
LARIEGWKRAQKVLERGLPLAGAIVAGINPQLAVAGPIIGTGLAGLLGEFLDRQISAQEQVRVGAAGAFALFGIQQKLEAGATPRQDGFFNSGVGRSGRSPAEELLEGVLIKARDQYEEAKIRHVAAIFVHAVFEPQFDAATLHWALATGTALSYRQLCCLHVLRDDAQRTSLRRTALPAHREPTGSEASLLVEIYDLYLRNLVYKQDNSPDRALALLGASDVAPAFMRLHFYGNRLYWLMDLQDVDPTAASATAALLAQ